MVTTLCVGKVKRGTHTPFFLSSLSIEVTNFYSLGNVFHNFCLLTTWFTSYIVCSQSPVALEQKKDGR